MKAKIKPRINDYRLLMLMGKRKEIPICKDCNQLSHGMPVDLDKDVEMLLKRCFPMSDRVMDEYSEKMLKIINDQHLIINAMRKLRWGMIILFDWVNKMARTSLNKEDKTGS